MFLDSGHPSPNAGRYDILAAEPVATLCTVGGRTEIHDTLGVSSSTADPFELLKQALHGRVPAAPDLPFSGGALGYFAYDLARRLERLPQHAQDEEGLPEMAVGV